MLETIKNKAKEYHENKKKIHSHDMVMGYSMEAFTAFLIVGAVAFASHVHINDIDLPSPAANNSYSSQDATNYLNRTKSNISTMKIQPTVRSSYSSRR